MLVAVVLATLAGAQVPVLDEESYLDITAQLDPLRPYDWWREWPPWGGQREPDAFIYAHPPGFLWWTWGAGQLVDGLFARRVVCALPLAVMLGWC
ncbi:MAG: hypothetical protein QGG40_04440, partial [Myxococcota bacterium]|nr:hypothetical protein [Myxococcota bacterium]